MYVPGVTVGSQTFGGAVASATCDTRVGGGAAGSKAGQGRTQGCVCVCDACTCVCEHVYQGYPQTAQRCLIGNLEGGAAAVRYDG